MSINKVNGLPLRIGEIYNFTDGHLVSYIWQNVEIRWILPLWWKIIWIWERNLVRNYILWRFWSFNPFFRFVSFRWTVSYLWNFNRIVGTESTRCFTISVSRWMENFMERRWRFGHFSLFYSWIKTSRQIEIKSKSTWEDAPSNGTLWTEKLKWNRCWFKKLPEKASRSTQKAHWWFVLACRFTTRGPNCIQ